MIGRTFLISLAIYLRPNVPLAQSYGVPGTYEQGFRTGPWTPTWRSSYHNNDWNYNPNQGLYSGYAPQQPPQEQPKPIQSADPPEDLFSRQRRRWRLESLETASTGQSPEQTPHQVDQEQTNNVNDNKQQVPKNNEVPKLFNLNLQQTVPTQPQTLEYKSESSYDGMGSWIANRKRKMQMGNEGEETTLPTERQISTEKDSHDDIKTVSDADKSNMVYVVPDEQSPKLNDNNNQLLIEQNGEDQSSPLKSILKNPQGEVSQEPKKRVTWADQPKSNEELQSPHKNSHNSQETVEIPSSADRTHISGERTPLTADSTQQVATEVEEEKKVQPKDSVQEDETRLRPVRRLRPGLESNNNKDLSENTEKSNNSPDKPTSTVPQHKKEDGLNVQGKIYTYQKIDRFPPIRIGEEYKNGDQRYSKTEHRNSGKDNIQQTDSDQIMHLSNDRLKPGMSKYSHDNNWLDQNHKVAPLPMFKPTDGVHTSPKPFPQRPPTERFRHDSTPHKGFPVKKSEDRGLMSRFGNWLGAKKETTGPSIHSPSEKMSADRFHNRHSHSNPSSKSTSIPAKPQVTHPVRPGVVVGSTNKATLERPPPVKGEKAGSDNNHEIASENEDVSGGKEVKQEGPGKPMGFPHVNQAPQRLIPPADGIHSRPTPVHPQRRPTQQHASASNKGLPAKKSENSGLWSKMGNLFGIKKKKVGPSISSHSKKSDNRLHTRPSQSRPTKPQINHHDRPHHHPVQPGIEASTNKPKLETHSPVKDGTANSENSHAEKSGSEPAVGGNANEQEGSEESIVLPHARKKPGTKTSETDQKQKAVPISKLKPLNGIHSSTRPVHSQRRPDQRLQLPSTTHKGLPSKQSKDSGIFRKIGSVFGINKKKTGPSEKKSSDQLHKRPSRPNPNSKSTSRPAKPGRPQVNNHPVQPSTVGSTENRKLDIPVNDEKVSSTDSHESASENDHPSGVNAGGKQAEQSIDLPHARRKPGTTGQGQKTVLISKLKPGNQIHPRPNSAPGQKRPPGRPTERPEHKSGRKQLPEKSGGVRATLKKVANAIGIGKKSKPNSETRRPNKITKTPHRPSRTPPAKPGLDQNHPHDGPVRTPSAEGPKKTTQATSDQHSVPPRPQKGPPGQGSPTRPKRFKEEIPASDKQGSANKQQSAEHQSGNTPNAPRKRNENEGQGKSEEGAHIVKSEVSGSSPAPENPLGGKEPPKSHPPARRPRPSAQADPDKGPRTPPSSSASGTNVETDQTPRARTQHRTPGTL